MIHLDTILICLGAFSCPAIASAQFYTLERSTDPLTVVVNSARQDADISEVSEIEEAIAPIKETLTDKREPEPAISCRGKNGEVNKFQKVQPTSELPELTIPNLLAEIKKNGIKYPKIVLAQAILETGWFKSSVCRNKHNLFGLTNPRTKTYYEFNHWTESVTAYYNKVQYRYSGGNYLLWLKKIGYAEDKGYIRAIISVLRQL